MEMESGNEERANELDALAEKCKVSFVETFLNEYGLPFMTMLMVEWLTGVYALIWCLL